MTTVPLYPFPVTTIVPSIRFLCRSWWSCYSDGSHTWRNRSDCLIATGEAVTIMPLAVRESLDLEIKPVAGWKDREPHWLGAPCLVGRTTIWLPIAEEPGQYRDFSLLALFPTDDLPHVVPYVLLGMQFFVEHRLQLTIDCSSAERAASITLA